MTKKELFRQMDEHRLKVRRAFRWTVVAAMFTSGFTAQLVGVTIGQYFWTLFWLLLTFAITDVIFSLRTVREHIPQWIWWGFVPAVGLTAFLQWQEWGESWRAYLVGLPLGAAWAMAAMVVAHRRSMASIEKLYPEEDSDDF